MPYITIPVKPQEYQISFEDIFFGVDEAQYERRMELQTRKNPYDTKTVYRQQTPQRLLDGIDFDKMINILARFNERHGDLLAVEDKATLYSPFKIPKRSGGLRQLYNPREDFKAALKELKFIFENQLFATHHTAAFAYCKGRCTINALKKHQQNGSRWFLKLDFHDFFGSSSPEFILRQLKLIFPFNIIIERGNGVLEKTLELCYMNNGLPQGSPMSPTLTNLFMIPIDHYIAKYVREHSPHLIYTRYADDILISSAYNFDWRQVQKDIIDIVSNKFKAPFTLNEKKTRYGSSGGRNWNLGLMLNKDNEITIGHAKKKLLKAKIYTFLRDDMAGNPWSVEDTQELQGQLSYYRSVEPENINAIVQSYNTKFKHDVDKTIKRILAA